ncbi:MAG TPA: beta-ketoacyl-ACP synthase II [Kiritimatiellia bacterium]
MQQRRVVITGMGIVSPLGCDLQRFWERLMAGQSGVRRITYFDVSAYNSQIAGEVVDFKVDDYVSKKEQRRMDPFTIYAMAASKLAVKDSGLALDQENAERIGVIIGSGVGGLQVLEEQMRILIAKGPSRFSPFMIPQMITNIAAGLVAIEFGVTGPNYCTTSACASATHGMGESLRIIQSGQADVMIAGGTEAPICELGVGGFCAMRALSTNSNDTPEKACRPFDKNRDGFIIAEAGAVLVLEEYEHAKKRGAHIYCELAGYGRTCDAFHMTAPDDKGRGASRGMQLAMEDAGCNTDDITYINAHGTSTSLNDKCETMAIKTAFGEERARKVMINSTKSMTGHSLGAAGALESVVCALSMQNGAIHGTMNYETPDPDCDLDYTPNQARQVKVKACLNNSLGFGGHNATLCFKAV